jgi:hypothetical protein
VAKAQEGGLFNFLQRGATAARAADFQGVALRRALAGQGLERVPTPVGVSAPGTNPFFVQRQQGLAALLGFTPELSEFERRQSQATGLAQGIVRRTA